MKLYGFCKTFFKKNGEFDVLFVYLHVHNYIFYFINNKYDSKRENYQNA